MIYFDTSTRLYIQRANIIDITFSMKLLFRQFPRKKFTKYCY